MCHKIQLQQLSVSNLKFPGIPQKRFVLQKAVGTQTSPTSSICFSLQNHTSHIQPLVNFKSSSSQTTFLDRNIVGNLTIQLLTSANTSLVMNKESFDEIEASCAGTVTSKPPSSTAGEHGGKAESGPVKPQTVTSMLQNKNVTASWSCSGASACGGSSGITKRASSISGTLPDGN